LSRDSLNRPDVEAGIGIRPPAVERDFQLGGGRWTLRHVIEPEIDYRFVTGIGARERKVLLVDTDDIATDTNEAGLSVTQRFYVRPNGERHCAPQDAQPDGECPAKPREWASWQVAEKFFFDPDFGGAVIPDHRNVFESTLDLTGVAFLTEQRNLAPLISRMRFEAVDNLRIEWDLDFDPKSGRIASDNLYAGYSWGSTTVGIGHAMLNAVDQNNAVASIIQSQQIQPFFSIGKQSRVGFDMAANMGYDFVQNSLQYAGVQAVYNWNCCGLTFGYRRFELGSIRDETQYLYSFTLANFGSVGDIRRSNSVFRDPSLPPVY
jgi:LPS-assembly protein